MAFDLVSGKTRVAREVLGVPVSASIEETPVSRLLEKEKTSASNWWVTINTQSVGVRFPSGRIASDPQKCVS
jgi:hypothetical protein